MSDSLNQNNESEIEDTRNQLKYHWKLEEMYWFQKSRINWLLNGDKNTRFFHAKTAQRKQKNHILSIKDSRGQGI
ncbi:hypothetical protein P3X46_007430 [Hevea brasiliensis]|uniref:Uncharacterized protein n=1 Tax=Hevea brasiliensis TaxID=3981 RepID=A0ABQ9MTM0_HEVBR|nr:hypothetical protein P3X46_007430 [Hevea brasiliensis]